MIKNCTPFLDSHFEKCQQYAGESQNVPTAKERREKSEYRVKNPDRKYIVKLLVDNCLIKGEENKCDYLYIDCNDKTIYLVELKGGDLSHAITQIESTINLLNGFLINFKIVARIVLTRSSSPRVTDQKKEKLIRGLKRWHQNQGISVSDLLKISTLRLEESI